MWVVWADGVQILPQPGIFFLSTAVHFFFVWPYSPNKQVQCLDVVIRDWITGQKGGQKVQQPPDRIYNTAGSVGGVKSVYIKAGREDSHHSRGRSQHEGADTSSRGRGHTGPAPRSHSRKYLLHWGIFTELGGFSFRSLLVLRFLVHVSETCA